MVNIFQALTVDGPIDFTYQTRSRAGFQPIEPMPIKLNLWTNGCKYFNIAGHDGEKLEFN